MLASELDLIQRLKEGNADRRRATDGHLLSQFDRPFTDTPAPCLKVLRDPRVE